MRPAGDPAPLVYLTVNDGPSGVYTGQVIDVVRLLRESLGIPTRLVAMVPLVFFRRHRSTIRSQMADAFVLPMVPKLRAWRTNLVLLACALRLLPRTSVIARNPLAANLALGCRRLGLARKVSYDGRGAVAAELAEYSPGNPLERSMPGIEQRAVLESDFRIAVSSKLVAYWQKEYQYQSRSHLVIPCSYSGYFERLDISQGEEKRLELGFLADDVVIVFAGGASGWQSTELIGGVVGALLAKSPKYKLLCLTQDPVAERLRLRFPAQVRGLWPEAKDVPTTMAAGDYGLLVREPTVTNRVAAPVKFAEYLACGLPVICSDCIGDYPGFLKLHNVGVVLNGCTTRRLELGRVSPSEKVRVRTVAEEFLSKASQAIRNSFAAVVEHLR